MHSLSRASCLPSVLRHVIINQKSWPNTTYSPVRRSRHCAIFIMTTTVGCRPNCPFCIAAVDAVQLRIWHSQRFCPHSRRVSVWLMTSSASQRTNKRTTIRFGLGWTEISSYLPTLIGKEIGTIFSALQPSSPWLPYSTSIVWHVSRRLRVLSRASGLTASQTIESTLSSTTTR